MIALILLLTICATTSGASECPGSSRSMTSARREQLLSLTKPHVKYDCEFEKEMQQRVDDCASAAPPERPGREFKVFESTHGPAVFEEFLDLMNSSLATEVFNVGASFGCGFNETNKCKEGFKLMCTLDYPTQTEEATGTEGEGEGSGEEDHDDKKGAEAEADEADSGEQTETTTKSTSVVAFEAAILVVSVVMFIII